MKIMASLDNEVSSVVITRHLTISKKNQEIGWIETVDQCEWFCSELYAPNCTWFWYDTKSRDCKIFNGTNIHEHCNELGFSSYPSFSECLSPFESSYDDSCYVSHLQVVNISTHLPKFYLLFKNMF